MSEVLNCPFCGSPGVLVRVPSEYGSSYQIVCEKTCEKRHVVGNPYAAREVWNRRYVPQAVCSTCGGDKCIGVKTDETIPCPVTERSVGVTELRDCPDCQSPEEMPK